MKFMQQFPDDDARRDRGFQWLETCAADVDRVAVMERPEVVLRVRGGAQIDGGAGSIAELEMTRKEVGMEVRQEHVRDLQPMFQCEREIAVDVALRIDDGRDPCLLVAYQV